MDSFKKRERTVLALTSMNLQNKLKEVRGQNLDNNNVPNLIKEKNNKSQGLSFAEDERVSPAQSFQLF